MQAQDQTKICRACGCEDAFPFYEIDSAFGEENARDSGFLEMPSRSAESTDMFSEDFEVINDLRKALSEARAAESDGQGIPAKQCWAGIKRGEIGFVLVGLIGMKLHRLDEKLCLFWSVFTKHDSWECKVVSTTSGIWHLKNCK